MLEWEVKRKSGHYLNKEKQVEIYLCDSEVGHLWSWILFKNDFRNSFL